MVTYVYEYDNEMVQLLKEKAVCQSPTQTGMTTTIAKDLIITAIAKDLIITAIAKDLTITAIAKDLIAMTCGDIYYGSIRHGTRRRVHRHGTRRRVHGHQRRDRAGMWADGHAACGMGHATSRNVGRRPWAVGHDGPWAMGCRP